MKNGIKMISSYTKIFIFLHLLKSGRICVWKEDDEKIIYLRWEWNGIFRDLCFTFFSELFFSLFTFIQWITFILNFFFHKDFIFFPTILKIITENRIWQVFCSFSELIMSLNFEIFSLTIKWFFSTFFWKSGENFSSFFTLFFYINFSQVFQVHFYTWMREKWKKWGQKWQE